MGKDHEVKYKEFIISRCTDVINSCNSMQQLNMAGKYCCQFKNVYYGFDEVWDDIWEVYHAKFKEFEYE